MLNNLLDNMSYYEIIMIIVAIMGASYCLVLLAENRSRRHKAKEAEKAKAAEAAYNEELRATAKRLYEEEERRRRILEAEERAKHEEKARLEAEARRNAELNAYIATTGGDSPPPDPYAESLHQASQREFEQNLKFMEAMEQMIDLARNDSPFNQSS